MRNRLKRHNQNSVPQIQRLRQRVQFMHISLIVAEFRKMQICMCHRLPNMHVSPFTDLSANARDGRSRGPAGAILRADDVSVAVVDWADGAMNAHHVVVIGAGFGGLETVHRLAGAPIRVTLIDRRNHHLFQPLL